MNFPSDLIERLRSAHRVVALTGAGVSAESGVPTFRDAQTGLWAQFRPEELATAEAFRRDPKRVWDWYAWRRERVDRVSPNPGHFALVEMERRVPEFLVITQNVDGLHQRAGSQRVLELHGNITRVKCFAEDTPVTTWKETGEGLPRCPRCGSWLRPDVVWFGETLPAGLMAEAERATVECELFFSIGTSALVYPAAGLALTAREANALLVEVNPRETPLTAQAGHVLRGLSGVVLPQLLRTVWPA